MKKDKSILRTIIPLVLILCLFVVFNSRITCKPNHVSFWFILALGMAIGLTLTRLADWLKAKKE